MDKLIREIEAIIASIAMFAPTTVHHVNGTKKREGKVYKPLLGNSYKVELSGTVGRLTAVMYLTPSRLCAFATVGCAAACLGHSTGRMKFDSSRQSRTWKTGLFLADKDLFFALLVRDIAKQVRKAERLGKVPAIRLNGSSDIAWERIYPDLFRLFPQCEFYDYTKAPIHARRLDGITNYHLTFSVSEDPKSAERTKAWLAAGYSAAAVIAGKHGTDKAEAKRVAAHIIATVPHAIDGDAHDHRPLDPAGSLVVLYAKGAALTDTSGFVQRHDI